MTAKNMAQPTISSFESLLLNNATKKGPPKSNQAEIIWRDVQVDGSPRKKKRIVTEARMISDSMAKIHGFIRAPSAA